MTMGSTEIMEFTTSEIFVNSSKNELCPLANSIPCSVYEFFRIAGPILLALSLLPQLIHLFRYRVRFIAGISYIWIIIRILALMFLKVEEASKWASLFKLIGCIITFIVFCQILTFSRNFHMQNKIILIVSSFLIWMTGSIFLFYRGNHQHILAIIGYSLFAVQMLPQVK